MIKGSDAFDFTIVEGKSDVMAGFAAKYSLRAVQSEKKQGHHCVIQFGDIIFLDGKK